MPRQIPEAHLHAILRTIKRISKEGLYLQLGLLYVVPKTAATSEPVIDELTRKMTAAFRNAEPLPWGYGGVHRCICGAESQSQDFILPDGRVTNSLCIHYLAGHRDAIPAAELEKVRLLPHGEAEPTAEEIQGQNNARCIATNY